MSYVVHIGLEIHIHLNTKTKMFCACKAHFGDEANTNICPVCMGLPGTLPVPNKEAITKALQVAHALRCRLAPHLQFDRKNYFYPDMPKNYQISQYFHPIGREGSFLFYHKGEKKQLGIHEIHMEEDAGKLIHADDASYADYNRAGYPLLEIVTKPNLHSPEETEVMLQQFHKTVQYLDVCDGNMEEGSLRCDANISLSTKKEELGAKVEIKNVNSFHFIKKALQFEIIRQGDLLDARQSVDQETRLWNENKDISEGMRSKEDVHDYRYLQEPDIPPCPIPQHLVSTAGEQKTELPVTRLIDLIETHRLDEKAAWLLTEDRDLGDTFYALLKDGYAAPMLAQWIAEELRKSLKKTGRNFAEARISHEDLQDFFELLSNEDISPRKAKKLIQAISEGRGSPRAILEAEGWVLISDEASITSYVREVCTAHQATVEQIRSGEEKGFEFLMGALMKASKGQINPKRGRDILHKLVYDNE